MSGWVLVPQQQCRKTRVLLPRRAGPCRLKAISWSLILICHSVALNTSRQIPADTRGRSDRKQFGGFFYQNLQTIPTVEKKSLEFSEVVHAWGSISKGKLTPLWPCEKSPWQKSMTYRNGKNDIYSSSCLCCKEGEVIHTLRCFVSPCWELRGRVGAVLSANMSSQTY